MATLFNIISTIQQTLFPALEVELAAPLGEKGELFVTVIELARSKAFCERFEWQGLPPPPGPPLSCLLDQIAHERLPPRRKRRNQRGVKCKMSNFPLRRLPPEDTSSERVVILGEP